MVRKLLTNRLLRRIQSILQHLREIISADVADGVAHVLVMAHVWQGGGAHVVWSSGDGRSRIFMGGAATKTFDDYSEDNDDDDEDERDNSSYDVHQGFTLNK